MTELSAKEKIKLKKKLAKQQALEEPKEDQKQVTADNPTQTVDINQSSNEVTRKRSKHKVEILAVYPDPNPKAKFFAKGNIKLKINSIGLELRSVPYSINQNKKPNIQKPFRYYRLPEEPDKKDVYVETVSFDDKSIWREVVHAAEAAVLKHHEVKADD